MDNRTNESQNEIMQAMKKSITGRNGVNNNFQDVSMSTMKTLGGGLPTHERVSTLRSTEIA